uniref:hypothetical protein n=1 Tax=Methylophaga sp. TaxID=2024840 RepID=UPI003A94ED85
MIGQCLTEGSFDQSPDKVSNAVEPQVSTVGCPRVVREMGKHFPDSPLRRNNDSINGVGWVEERNPTYIKTQDLLGFTGSTQ